MSSVIALDVSMGKSAIVVYNPHQQCQYEGEIKHTVSGFQSLKKRIDWLIKETGCLPEIVFEATGVYSQALESFLQENNYYYYCINPLEAKIQTASMRRQKTDVSDAHELAKSHFKSERSKTYIQDNYYEQMRGLGRYYDELEKESGRHSNRLHALLQLSFPLLEKYISKKSDLFLNIVQLYPHAGALNNLSVDEVKNKVFQATKKNLSVKQARDYATALIKAATESYAAIQLDDVRCRQIKQCAKRLLDFKKDQVEIIKEMVALSKGKIDYQIFLSFPGIGEKTAVRIIGELGDIRRFKNHRQINAFVGIDVQRYQSGKTQYQDRINKRGNRRLRKILYFMVKTMITMRSYNNNHLVEYYDHLKKQPLSKPHKVAVIASVNKFLKIAFHLIQHNIQYDYSTATSKS